MNPSKIIISVTASLIAAAVLSATLGDHVRQSEKERRARESVAGNPLADEYEKIGKRYGLNMDFAEKAVCKKDVSLDFDRDSVLDGKKKSFDVIIIGDSSMAWGLVPEAIERLSGLRVGLFVYEALILNATLVKVIDNIVSYYLKDDGLLVLSFGTWTQSQKADSIVLVNVDWIMQVSRMNHNQFADFIEQWKKEKNEGAGKRSIANFLLFSVYHQAQASIKKALGENFHLSLLQLSPYQDYIEPVINPRVYKMKKEMLSNIECYLHWNNKSITICMSKALKKSRHSEALPDPSFVSKEIGIISSLLKKIKCRKAYQIHISSDEKTYANLRSIYSKYYADFCGLIDLGKEHPKNESFDLDSKEHTVNAAGLYQSIFIGKFLKNHFKDLGRRVNTPAGK